MNDSNNFRAESGEESYIIPAGGSNTTGDFGYFEAFAEMLSQGILNHVTDIVFTCATGGTMAGLAIANYLASKGAIRLVFQNHKREF